MRIDRTLLDSLVAFLVGSGPLPALDCIIQPGLWVCGHVEASYGLTGVLSSAKSGSAFRSIDPSTPSYRLVRQMAATAALVAGMICAAPASAQSTPSDLRLFAVLRAEDYTPAHVVDFLVIDEPVDGEGNYSFAAATAGSLAGVITQMDHGWTRVVGNAAASKIGVPGTSADCDFVIEAVTTDRLTIDLPGIPTGTPLTIEMGLHLEGGLSAAGEGDVNIAYAGSHGIARLTLGARSSLSSPTESWTFGPVQYDSPDVDPGILIDDDFSIDVTFADGVPFDLRYVLNIEGYAGMFVFYFAEVPFAGATGTFVGDFGHTLTWAGLSNLQDELGQPLDMTDMEVSSVSGADYRNPIIPTPEPGPGSTLLAGLVALAGFARRRSRGGRRLRWKYDGSSSSDRLEGRSGLSASSRNRVVATIATIASSSLHGTAAFASDGILEINQTCAVQTGCFAGDSAGFPVTIDGTAGHSYRLTSDLVMPDQNSAGIRFTTDDISVDLAGFAIRGTFVCSGTPLSCTPTSGSGSGVAVSLSSLSGHSVRNGTIRGMGTHGLFLGPGAEVANVRVHSNRIVGIVVGPGSTLSGNSVHHNGGNGISASNGSNVFGNTSYENGDGGITSGMGSTVSGNSVLGNAGDGIETLVGGLVHGNSVIINGGFGLRLGTQSGYRENAIGTNTAGTVTGGVNLGDNACVGSTTCP